MADTSSKTSTAAAVCIAFGSTAGAVCFAALLMGAIVLSLIPVYTSDRSELGYGEEYRINALMLKSLYELPPGPPLYAFSNSTMADNTQLSKLCADTYRNMSQQNVAGCIIENIKAWGGFNNLTTLKRRRRAFPLLGLYTVSRARIFYSTPCTRRADRGKFINNNSFGLSYCVSQRLKACNRLFTSPTLSSPLVPWATPPASMAYSIVEYYFTNFITLAVVKVFGVSLERALQLSSTNLSLPINTTNYMAAGCQYIGPLPQAEIATIIAAQTTQTTTQPSSTFAG